MMNIFSFYVFFLAFFLTQEGVASPYTEANDHDVTQMDIKIATKGYKNGVAKKIRKSPPSSKKIAALRAVFARNKSSAPVSVIKMSSTKKKTGSPRVLLKACKNPDVQVELTAQRSHLAFCKKQEPVVPISLLKQVLIREAHKKKSSAPVSVIKLAPPASPSQEGSLRGTANNRTAKQAARERKKHKSEVKQAPQRPHLEFTPKKALG